MRPSMIEFGTMVNASRTTFNGCSMASMKFKMCKDGRLCFRAKPNIHRDRVPIQRMATTTSGFAIVTDQWMLDVHQLRFSNSGTLPESTFHANWCSHCTSNGAIVILCNALGPLRAEYINNRIDRFQEYCRGSLLAVNQLENAWRSRTLRHRQFHRTQ